MLLEKVTRQVGQKPTDRELVTRHLRAIRFWLVLFIIRASPQRGDRLPARARDSPPESDLSCRGAAIPLAAGEPSLHSWLRRVHEGLVPTNESYPFMAYGTDWLAFAHLVIAIAFVGPLIDPVRNKWVLQFGVIACAGVIPLALIAGPIRGIPPIGDSSTAALESSASFRFSSACIMFASSNALPAQFPTIESA
jgi:hypothetical protein